MSRKTAQRMRASGECPWDDRHYAGSVVAGAAGCTDVTFRSWRNRSGFLPGSKGRREEQKHFSLVDALLTRVAVVAGDHGVGIAEVVIAEPLLREAFQHLLVEKEFPTVLAFHRLSKGALKHEFLFPDRLPALLKESGGGIVVVDLRRVMTDVCDALKYRVKAGEVAKFSARGRL